MKKVALIILGGLILVGGNCSKNPVKDGPGIPPPPQWHIMNLYPSWSPDGSTIAYYHETDNALDPNDSSGYYLINTDGTNNRLIFRMWPPSGRGTWSPDGKYLAFEAGYQIYKLEISTEVLTQLTFSGENVAPDWSPDGTSLVYYDLSMLPLTGLKFIDTIGNLLCSVTDSMSELLFPTWSPNGNRVAYCKYIRLNSQGSIQLELFTMNECGGNGVRLTYDNSVFDDLYPDWSSFTDNIVWTRYPDGIWVMDSNGSNQKLLMKGGEYAVWSPDGEWIAYQALSNDDPDNPDNITIWIMDKEGRNNRIFIGTK